MKTATKILLVVVGLLLLADISSRIWTWNANNLRVGDRQFKVVPFRTNDVSGVGIAEAKTGKLLWVEWDYADKSKEFSYFYRGTNILNLNVWPDRPLTYSVGFHGQEKVRCGGGTLPEELS